MKSARTFAFWLLTTIGLMFWAGLVKAAPVSISDQVYVCTNAVVLELEGVPRAEITGTPAEEQLDGTGRIRWNTRDGRSGSCWIDETGQSVQVEVENGEITNPVVLENDATAIPGATMIVSTDGGSLNLRRAPAGEVTGMIPDGSTVVLTGQTNGEWVELEDGSWVSRYHLIHAKPPVPLNEPPSNAGEASLEPVASSGSRVPGAAIVRSGAGINIRRSPDGEVFASVPDGATVILTGQRDGEWVEIEGGGWVFEGYLQQ